jgi:dienelactone hydrolase
VNWRPILLYPLLAMLPGVLLSAPAAAKVFTRTVPYQYEGKTYQGYLAYDDANKGPRPGVLVVHEWWGLNDYAKSRTRQLAELGYVAFAPDMYGDGKTTSDPKEAQALSSAVSSQPGQFAALSNAGLDVLRKQPQVDGERLAAIGFCFGGTAVLQLAYSGVPLKAVVTFHAGLVVPDATQAAAIRTPIVILHGDEDPFNKPETVDGVRKALDAAKVDWYLVSYGNAVHAFSDPASDSYKIPGIAYNEKAARRSWDEMQRFFNERFSTGKGKGK